MKLLGIIVAVFSVVAAIAAGISGDKVLYLLAGFSLAAAFSTFLSSNISHFLQILIRFFSIEIVVFGFLVCLGSLGAWPDSLEAIRIQSSLAITVALFSITCYVASYIPVARQVLAITDRYFCAETRFTVPLFGRRISIKEKSFAAATISFILLLNQLEVFFHVSISFASSAMFNAFQSYDAPAFWTALLVKLPLFLTPYIVALFVEFIAASALAIRWRQWLTEDYSRRWLDHHNHYRMMLAGVGTDNPDQRISEDIPRFIDGGEFGGAGRLGVYNFSINLIATLSSLVSYSVILWGLSANLTIPGTSFAVPGLLLWCAIIYAILGTVATFVIGRPLAALAFARQHYEANFRFGLARLREYTEQIALLAGEATEKRILVDRFSFIVRNFYSIVFVRAFLTAFTSFFDVISFFIPYIIMGPFYFAKKVKLGEMTLAQSAFGNVSGALTFFVSYYTALADFKSVLDRLTTFDTSLENAAPARSLVRTRETAKNEFVLSDVSIALPNHAVLSEPFSLRLAANENVLLTGPSGSGKSTFFRTISGVWPYRDGRIELPEGASVMVLPQKPYLPIGTLRTAISYPEPVGTYSDDHIVEVLRDVGLGQIVDTLDVDDNLGQRLSGGEQQRLAIARAVLRQPGWLLLDEATSAMDMALETKVYELLARRLPDTTIVSIAHRDTLAAHHVRHLSMQPTSSGRFAPEDAKAAAE